MAALRPIPLPAAAICRLRRAAHRKTGDGWQTRMNTDLRKARKRKVG
jgi:hypothetical protein